MIAAAILLLAAQTDPAAMIARAGAVTAPVTRAPAPDRSARYRVDADEDGASGPDAKMRAAATTGIQCGVVGAKLCTRKPRTWLKAPIGN